LTKILSVPSASSLKSLALRPWTEVRTVMNWGSYREGKWTKTLDTENLDSYPDFSTHLAVHLGAVS
jgi:hypothetical protein